MTDVKDLYLRDWFAGQPLAGILANSDFPKQGSGEPVMQYAARVTDTAYRIAEAMVNQGRRLKKETCGVVAARP
jgi:hypothetical protein